MAKFFPKIWQNFKFLMQNFDGFFATDKHSRRQDKNYMPANSFPGA